MRNNMLIKMEVVFFLVLVMRVPFGWVPDLISERNQIREVNWSSVA